MAEGQGSASSADLAQQQHLATCSEAGYRPRTRNHLMSFAAEVGLKRVLELRRFKCKHCFSAEPLTPVPHQDNLACFTCRPASMPQGPVAGCGYCKAIMCAHCVIRADIAWRSRAWASTEDMEEGDRLVTQMQLLSEYRVYASQVPTTSPAVAGVTGAVCPAIPLTVGRTPRTALWLWGAGDGDPDMWFRSPTFCVAGQQYYYRLFIPESLATHRALAQAAQPATAATALAAALAAASAVAGRGRGGDAPRPAYSIRVLHPGGRRGPPSMATYRRSLICWWGGYECFWCSSNQAWAYKDQDGVLRWWVDWLFWRLPGPRSATKCVPSGE